MLLTLKQFGGSLPVRNLRNLPDLNGVYAENVKIDGGGFHAVHPPKIITNPHFKGPGLGTGIVRVYGVVDDPLKRPDLYSNMLFMGFGDLDTDVARTPNINDSFERYYFCSPSTGLQVVTKAGIVAYSQLNNYVLQGPITGTKVGVVPPDPDTPFTAKEDTTTGELVWIEAGDTPIPHNAHDLVTDPQYRFYKNDQGLSMTEYRELVTTREYLITYVNIWGEESQPGATVEVDVAADQVVDLSNIPVPANVPGYAAYAKKRLYRTVVAADGSAPFRFVIDLALDATTLRDDHRDVDISGNDNLESTSWTLPPDGMQGMIAMPTGYMVGFIGKDLYFSEAYNPHAWPDKYRITVEHQIVGLGITAGTLVVLTSGRPVLINGARPDLVQQDATAQSMPCVSRGSIVSTPTGVIFASDNGFMMFGQSGVARLTDDVIGSEAWRRDFIPYSVRACMLSDGTLVFTHLDAAGVLRCDSFRPDLAAAGIVRITLSIVFSEALMTEVNTGRAMILSKNGGSLFELMPAYTTDRQIAIWTSKEFQMPSYTNFGALRMDWDRSSGGVAFTLWAIARNGDRETRIELFDWGYGVLDTPGEVYRLPTGVRYDTFQIEIAGTATIYQVQLASTVAELRNA